jgi:hypothetical protein
MAERRMFAKTIIDSDAFLDMPLSSQALYFHLGMRADDEGFINSPRKIMRMVGASEDDMKILTAKNFVIPFQSGVVVIKHWRLHNYIQKDRYKETVYQEERKMLTVKDNNVYSLDTTCIQSADGMDTQYSIGKDSIGKDSIERERAHAHTREEKTNFKLYGICGNIRLTDDEMNELSKMYPALYSDYIDRVSLHKKSEGREYNDDFATILKWIRKDKDKEKANRKEDCINDRSEYGNSDGLYEGFATALDDAKD